jgi:transcriptional regulator with XRE-family HTH domain
VWCTVRRMEDLTGIHIDPVKFKAARERCGLTQEQVGEAVGVQKAAISKLETGYGRPSADVMARLCLLLKVEISELTSEAQAA